MLVLYRLKRREVDRRREVKAMGRGGLRREVWGREQQASEDPRSESRTAGKQRAAINGQ